MARKRIHINEDRFKLLFERISDKLWHFTQPSTVLAILKTNKIGCTFSQNRSDAYSNKHLYYICMSRTRTVYDNSWGKNKVARIQFDGYELNKHYSGKPINYYGWSKGDLQGRGMFEYEDRVFSDKPYIDNADKYITRIDLLYNVTQANEANTYKEILHLSKETGIPVYFYGNKLDYSRQTNNTINDQIENLDGPENVEPYRRKISFPKILSELFAIRYLVDSNPDAYDPWNPLSEKARLQVSSYLGKYGFEKYTDDVLKELHYTTPYNSLRDSSISFLSNGSDFRQAHMISQSPKEGEMVQRMAIDLMKEFGASSIDRLIANVVNNKERKTNLATEVKCVTKQYNWSDLKRLYDGDDNAMEEFGNVNNIIETIYYCAMDDENYLQPGEDEYDDYKRKISHKSKSANHLMAYLKKKLNKDCTIYELAETVIKLFNGDKEKMKNELGFSLEAFTLNKKQFAEIERELSLMDGFSFSQLVKKLFGDYDGLFEYEREQGLSQQSTTHE